MNIYDVRISGQPHPIQVRASKASIALARALRRLTDSQFLNTAISIRFVGRVSKVYRIRAYVWLGEGRRQVQTVVENLTAHPTDLELADLQAAHPEWSYLHVKCSPGGRR